MNSICWTTDEQDIIINPNEVAMHDQKIFMCDMLALFALVCKHKQPGLGIHRRREKIGA
ncbi:MAG: hypothetical protein IKV82_05180 [Akkermansia sp.]|nr:hypothetical protein [Akkermansia sp.]